MNIISDGAQLKELAEKCGNNEKELSQISITMNKEFDYLTQNMKTQMKTVDDNILVKFEFLHKLNPKNIYLI